mgnify:CR=1 FL=1
MDSSVLQTYAQLIIKKGINLQKGKGVVILTGIGTYYFARELSKCAYSEGASYVQVMIDDQDVLASRLTHQDEQQVQFSPNFLKALDYEFCAEGWSYIRIDSTDERLDHAPFDPEKHQLYSTAKRKFSEARAKKLMRHQLPWCVCVAPGPLWAKQVLGEEATEDDLMEVLKPILLLDTEDPLKAWDDKKEVLIKRQRYLNSLGLESLHFTSSKADLVVGLTEQARFVGGGEKLPDGTEFFPNIPTEEIFTTPDFRKADGYITTTKPVEVLGTTTEEVTFVFRNGKVVEHSAKSGSEAITRFFAIDEGTRSIGEVALVDETSPIAKSNVIFNSILLDENASCHLALGDGYPTALANGSQLRDEAQLRDAGCNTSLMHVDFMVGSKDMQITGLCRNKEQVLLMKDGVFVF